jgi:hypothetical protein
MKMCEKCNRIVTGTTVCTDDACPFPAALERGMAAPVADPAVVAGPPQARTPTNSKSDDTEAVPTQRARPDQGGNDGLVARFCAECGGKVRTGSAFCGQCGTAVVAPLTPAKIDLPASAPSSAPAPDAVQFGEAESASPSQPAELDEPIAAVATSMEEVPQEPEAPQDTAGEPVKEQDVAADSPLATSPEPVTAEPAEGPVSAAESPAEPAADGEAEERGDWDYAEDDEPAGPASGNGKWIALAAVVLLLTGGGGAWYFLQASGTEATQAKDPAERLATNEPQVPMLSGSYAGFYMDQNIFITIADGAPRTLVNANGMASYSNVVTGGRCVSRLEPVSGGGIGGDTNNAVRFSQQPVPGEPECSQEIPVKIDISERALGLDGVVEAMSVEWLTPQGDEVLMKGELTRESGQ